MKVYFGFLVAGSSLYLSKSFGGDWGVLLGLLGLIFGLLLVLYYLVELHKPITKLLNTSGKAIKPTN